MKLRKQKTEPTVVITQAELTALITRLVVLEIAVALPKAISDAFNGAENE